MPCHWPPRALLLGALLVLAPSAGCRRSVGDAEKAQAEATVRRFFEALPSGDCKVLGELLALEPNGKRCEELVGEMNRHGLRLLSVIGSSVDGRAPDAVLVRTQMEQQGHPHQEPTLVRVERQANGWRIRL
jgi:hypothetical protein